MSKNHIVGTTEMVQPSGKTGELQPLENLEQLGRRAVACKRWRWLDGTLRVVPAPHKGATGYTIRVPQDGYREAPGEYPDLSDPATLGCLLALVREVHNEPTAFVERHPIGAPWQVHTVDGGIFAQGETEAAALVAALEAAP